MSEVRIFVDGIEHTVSKAMFADMMYACEQQADQWYFSNTMRNNDDLASKWLSVSERARDLKYVVEDVVRD